MSEDNPHRQGWEFVVRVNKLIVYSLLNYNLCEISDKDNKKNLIS